MTQLSPGQQGDRPDENRPGGGGRRTAMMADRSRGEALPRWADEVVALYERDPDMDAQEFERLLSVALTGARPDHRGLPAYLPLA